MSDGDYEALDIAKFVINKCTVEKHPISNLQLQKILYIIQRNHLADYGSCLFHDEIQAWQFGPVVPEVYYHFCGFGSGAITIRYIVPLKKSDEDFINPIVENARTREPWDMVSEIHAPGKAWDMTYRNGSGDRYVMPTELIKEKG